MALKIETSEKGMSRGTGVLFLLAALFLAFALFSYDPHDCAFFTTKVNEPLKNYAGVLGSWIGFFLFLTFGLASYLFPLIGLMICFSAFSSLQRPNFWKKTFMGIAFVALSSLLLAIQTLLSFGGWIATVNIPNAGGVVGQRIASGILTKYIGIEGALLLLIPLWLASAVLFFDIPWALVFDKVKEIVLQLPSLFKQRNRRIAIGGLRVGPSAGRVLKTDRNGDEEAQEVWRRSEPPVLHTGPMMKPLVEQIPKLSVNPLKKLMTGIGKSKEGAGARSLKTSTGAGGVIKPSIKPGEYQLPTLQLLDNPPSEPAKELHEDLQQNAKILEATLLDFGVDAQVVEVHRGPVITRYELQPAPGIKVNRITALSDDIALAMKAASIRIVAPIPGKAAVGIEVPNPKSVMVVLKELLVSDEFETSRAKIPLALGKDVSGKPIIADLTDMPHLLIAGATGSGKTVCVNSIILSILYTLSPEQCRLLLVDPKMVELSNYKDLPQLVGPVVTDPKKVSQALHFAVREMEKRYKMFAEVGVRNIEGFNQRPSKEERRLMPAETSGVNPEEGPIESELIPSTLPYLVIIIDELADLMMISPVDIESAITRLAQLSRAVGIHMILATQRPSVDVITGVIKANFPARISFQVASKVDSRTILDANGADKLLGKGDMLFLPPGSSKLIRAQGTWVNDQEIGRVINFIKAQGTADYALDVFEAVKKGSSMSVSMDEDDLYDEAVQTVLQTQQASASVLQRRLRVGYARAARLIDMMEERGIVGPFRGSKARDILVKRSSGRDNED